MTTLEETDAAPAAPDTTHLQAATAEGEAGKAAAAAAVSADGELDPELTTDFHVDPAYTTPKQLEEEEQAEAARKANKDRIHSLKSVVIISGVVVAVVGAIFAVAKKVKEA